MNGNHESCKDSASISTEFGQIRHPEISEQARWLCMAYPSKTSYKKHGRHPRGQVLEALEHGKRTGSFSFNLTVCFCWEVLISFVWYFLGEDQGYSQAEDQEHLNTHKKKKKHPRFLF